MLQPQLRIRDTRLTLLPEQGAMRQVGASELLLQNSRTEHQLSGSLELPEAGDAGALRFAVETREVPADPLTADYDFYLDLDRLGPELLNLDYLPLRIEALSFDTEFWGRFSGGSLEYLQGGLALAQLRTDDPRLPTVEAGRTGFALLRRNDGYQLQLNDLVFASAGATLELDQLVLDSSWRDGRPRARALSGPVFDLAKVGQWLQVQPFVSEPLRATIERLAPQGAMRNLRLNLPPSGDPGEFSLAGDLERVSVEAAWGAPRISGISGRLEADRQGGRLHLDSEAFELFFPELYDQGWQYDRANGLVRWSLQPDQAVIGSELLHLGNPSVSAAGRFSLALPYDRAIQTELTLMIGMVDSDGLQTANYVPPEQVGRALHRWLGEAIGGGRLQRGGLVLRTGTRSLDEGREPTVQMFFDVDDAGLAYQPGWPGIDDGQVFVLLRDRELLVEVEGGRLLDSVIEHARVYLPGPGAPLQVSGRVAGGAGDIRRLLLESPLRSLVGEALSPWQLDGSARTDVRLSIPWAVSSRRRLRSRVVSRLDVWYRTNCGWSSRRSRVSCSTARPGGCAAKGSRDHCSGCRSAP
ncbi:DUF3971 domain-containing protein [Marinobacterium aestuariivivens]|uniref:DUF3971 domain-containing protein n=1 Tax=Marinobacterium aestuariivivens TaxID=1698799 RepID=A0ABW1ZWE4_9GAMM